ncbi:hypothetical protein [Embleya sp. AB8]|uniref:hypothetical protein n=1 Tax=Embleya sp. AB8 TaxID=3156304 RepID=UPI003C78EBD7
MQDEEALAVVFGALERDVRRVVDGGRVPFDRLLARRSRRHRVLASAAFVAGPALVLGIRLVRTRNRSPARERGWGRDARGGYSAT